MLISALLYGIIQDILFEIVRNLKVDFHGIDMNILIFAANWNNRGDESAVRALIDELKIRYWNCSIRIHYNQNVKTFPYNDIEIIGPIVKPSKKHIINYFGYQIYKYSNGEKNFTIGVLHENIKKFINAVKWADFAIYAPGGPSIGNHYKQYYLVDMMKILYNHNVPYFIFAPSFVPFNRYKNYISQYLNQALYICVREELSKKYLQEIGVKNAEVTLDAAFQHKISFPEEQKILLLDSDLSSFLSMHKDKVIGLTITDLLWRFNDAELSDNIFSIFSSFINTYSSQGYYFLFIPQIFDVNYGGEKEIINKLTNSNTYCLNNNYDCYFQQYIISQLHCVIGMRYHSNIFSAKMKTPFISIAYEHKMEGFMEKAKLSQYCININDFTYKNLDEKFILMESNYNKYKNFLIQENNLLVNESKRTMERLSRVIDHLNIEND